MRCIAVLLLAASVAAAQDAAEKKMRAEDYEGALAEYDKMIAAAPEDPRGHRGRGRALHYLDRYEESIASYDRAIALTKTPDPDFHYERGLVKWSRDDLSGADVSAREDHA